MHFSRISKNTRPSFFILQDCSVRNKPENTTEEESQDSSSFATKYLFFHQHATQVHGLAVVPQALQTVELTCLLREDVDHYAAVIQQDPGTVAVAFTAQGHLVRLFLHSLFHAAAQGVDLGVGAAGGDDKIVRQSGLLGNFDGGNLLALLFIPRLCRDDC